MNESHWLDETNHAFNAEIAGTKNQYIFDLLRGQKREEQGARGRVRFHQITNREAFSCYSYMQKKNKERRSTQKPSLFYHRQLQKKREEHKLKWIRRFFAFKL